MKKGLLFLLMSLTLGAIAHPRIKTLHANDDTPAVNPTALSRSASQGLNLLSYQYDPASGNVSFSLPTPFVSLQYDSSDIALHPYGLANGWRIAGLSMIVKSDDPRNKPYDNTLYLPSGASFNFADQSSAGEIKLVDNKLQSTRFFRTDASEPLSSYLGKGDIGNDDKVAYVLVSDQSRLFHLPDDLSTDAINDPNTFKNAYGVTRTYFDALGNPLGSEDQNNQATFYQTGGNIAMLYPNLTEGEVVFASENTLGQIDGILFNGSALQIGRLSQGDAGLSMTDDDAKTAYTVNVTGSLTNSSDVTSIVTPTVSGSGGTPDTYTFNNQPYLQFEDQGSVTPGIEDFPESLTTPTGTLEAALPKQVAYKGAYGLSDYYNNFYYLELEDNNQLDQVKLPGIGLVEDQDASGNIESQTYGGYLDHPENPVSPSASSPVGSGATTSMGTASSTSPSITPFIATAFPSTPYTEAMYNQSSWKYFGGNGDFAINREAGVSGDSVSGNVTGVDSDTVTNHLGLAIENYTHYVSGSNDTPVMRTLTEYSGAHADSAGNGQFTGFDAYQTLAGNYDQPKAVYTELYDEADPKVSKTSVMTMNYADDGFNSLQSSTDYRNNSQQTVNLPTDGNGSLTLSMPAPDNDGTWQNSPDQTDDFNQIKQDDAHFKAAFSPTLTKTVTQNPCLDNSTNLCVQTVTKDDGQKGKQLFSEDELNDQGELIKRTAGYVDGSGTYQAVSQVRYTYWNDAAGNHPLSINGHAPLLLKSEITTNLAPHLNDDTADPVIEKIDANFPSETTHETDYYYSYQLGDTNTPYDLSDATDTTGQSVIADPTGTDGGVLVVTTATPYQEAGKAAPAWVSRQYLDYHTGEVFMDENAHSEDGLDATSGQGTTSARIEQTSYRYDQAGRVVESYDHLLKTAVENTYGDHAKGRYSDVSVRDNITDNGAVMTGAKKSVYDAFGRLTEVYDNQTVDTDNNPTHLLYQYVYGDKTDGFSSEETLNAQNKPIARISYGYATGGNGSDTLVNQPVLTETWHYNDQGKVDTSRTFKGSPEVSDYYNDQADALITSSQNLSDAVYQTTLTHTSNLEGQPLSFQNNGKTWSNDQGEPLVALSLPLSDNGKDIQDPSSVPGSALMVRSYDNMGALLKQDAYLNLNSTTGAAQYHLMSETTPALGPVNNVLETTTQSQTESGDAITLASHSFTSGSGGSSFNIIREGNDLSSASYASGDVVNYDELGRVSSIDKPYLFSGNTPTLKGQSSGSEHYVYDDNGAVTEMTDFAGNTTVYQYNADGSLAKTVTTSADKAETITYQYTYYSKSDTDRPDLIGQLKRVERSESGDDQLGIAPSDTAMAYHYSDVNSGQQMTEVDYFLDASATTPDFRESYTYDPNGKVTARTDANLDNGHRFTESYVYDNDENDDNYGKVDTITQSSDLSLTGNDSKTWNFSYYRKEDSLYTAGEVSDVKMTDSGDPKNSYTIHDSYNTLTASPDIAALRNQGTLQSKVIKDGAGNLIEGITYHYDDQGRPSQVDYQGQSAKDSYTVVDDYDAVDELVRETDYPYQQTKAAPFKSLSYSYDPKTGALLSVSDNTQVTQYHYDATTHVPEGMTTPSNSEVSFNPDAGDNLTQDDQGHHFVYNAEGQLAGVSGTQPDQYTARYDYWPDGSRSHKQISESSHQLDEYFTYDAVDTDNAQVTLEIETLDKAPLSQSLEAASVLYGDQHIARVYTTSDGSGGISSHLNNLFSDGKSTMATQNDGTLAYDPMTAYGNPLALPSSFNPEQIETDVPMIEALQLSNNPFRYNGEQQDSESGLVYLRARYYDPHLSLFIQRDPYQGTFNKWNAFGGNPAINIDPNGMNFVTQFLKHTFANFSNWHDGIASVLNGLAVVSGGSLAPLAAAWNTANAGINAGENGGGFLGGLKASGISLGFNLIGYYFGGNGFNNQLNPVNQLNTTLPGQLADQYAVGPGLSSVETQLLTTGTVSWQQVGEDIVDSDVESAMQQVFMLLGFALGGAKNMEYSGYEYDNGNGGYNDNGGGNDQGGQGGQRARHYLENNIGRDTFRKEQMQRFIDKPTLVIKKAQKSQQSDQNDDNSANFKQISQHNTKRDDWYPELNQRNNKSQSMLQLMSDNRENFKKPELHIKTDSKSLSNLNLHERRAMELNTNGIGLRNYTPGTVTKYEVQDLNNQVIEENKNNEEI